MRILQFKKSAWLLAAVMLPLFGGEPDKAKLPAAANREVDFVKDIQPIFRANCYSCHGAEKQKGGLRLDVKALALKGGNDIDIVPGKSEKSPLLINVAWLNEDSRMPPPEKGGKKLSDEQIGLLRAWIDQGAKWPDGVDDGKIKDPRDHWAFKKPVQVLPHGVHDGKW